MNAAENQSTAKRKLNLIVSFRVNDSLDLADDVSRDSFSALSVITVSDGIWNEPDFQEDMAICLIHGVKYMENDDTLR